ncbi:MAG: hypothetical protein A2X60_18200 [Ignavibacteria bacterium GWF2_35_20]|nr:MAG: hypothetical protein A2X60_18200 [Ignavibacteria bacterium GWF2_35_20]
MEQCFLSFECFNKIMNLITSLDESASCLLKMLNDSPVLTEFELLQKKRSEKILLDIIERSKRVKRDWIDTGLNQNNFPEKIKNFNTDFGNIQNDFTTIYQIIEDISSENLFVDNNGNLIKQTKRR